VIPKALVPATPKNMLVFDCNGICWGAYHALPNLSHKEQCTAIIYGFLNTLFHIQKSEMADTLVFVWDDTAPYCKRTEYYPEYKIKRKNTRKEMTKPEKEEFARIVKQFSQLKDEILPELGFSNIFSQEGYEGDDIIASIVRSNPKARIKLICRDGDLLQMINSRVTMFDWQQNLLMNEEYVFSTYGVYPDRWADVKSLAGCPTDEIPGLPSIGYGRAATYLNGKMKPTSTFYSTIVNGKETIEFTRKLVTLPFDGVSTFTLHEDTCKVNKLKRVARVWGLNSYTVFGRIKDYIECFC